jgi:hypothetical protein
MLGVEASLTPIQMVANHLQYLGYQFVFDDLGCTARHDSKPWFRIYAQEKNSVHVSICGGVTSQSKRQRFSKFLESHER